jgi:glycogen debranching enzyme
MLPHLESSLVEPATNLDQVTVIEQTSFAVSDGRGDMVPGGSHGFFISDTRHLSRFGLRLGGKRLERLSAANAQHNSAAFYLANPPVGRLGPNTLAVFRDRRVAIDLEERIRVISYAPRSLKLRLSIVLDADFADIFEVRGRRRIARQVRVEHDATSVSFIYEHLGYRRVTTVEADRAFVADDRRIGFDLALRRGVPWDVHLRMRGERTHGEGVKPLPAARPVDPGRIQAWAERVPALESDDRRLVEAWEQAIRDMRALLLAEPGGWFIPAAGLPWFIAVFGRDAAITALQSLLTGMEIAYGTLSQLAAYQGRAVDAFREEQPGKIAHEVRTGELATLEHVPHERYYGSVDATPLFVMLFAAACQWSGWLVAPPSTSGDGARRAAANGPMPRVLRGLLPAVDAAMDWIDRYAIARDGLIWYQGLQRRGIRNQAWKDSSDSYCFADGRLARTPIAPVEVQGYVVAAKRGLADVLEALGRRERPKQLRVEADQIARLIDEAFWMPERATFALGLDRFGRQIDSVTSNPGHLLWCGAVSAERATAVAHRLMAPDMFSGWGIRTLSNEMAGYNPISYHNGSVWPHDNSLVAAGMARYGLEEHAWRVIDAQLDAATADADRRLPELLAGFDRAATPDLVAYPSACSPQAWSSGAIFLAAQTLLGLQPAGGAPWLDPILLAPRLSLHNVQVGSWRGTLENRQRRPP